MDYAELYLDSSRGEFGMRIFAPFPQEEREECDGTHGGEGELRTRETESPGVHGGELERRLSRPGARSGSSFHRR